MNSRLKNLYKHVIENRIHEVKVWHDAYMQFHKKVDEVREQINDGKGFSPDNKDFLNQLLYEKSNGIASRGQSVLSYENFELFIKNEVFINALKQLILDPKIETFQNFEAAWSNQGKGNNPVLINRVAAACSLDVSTTVDSGKFNQVFSWLIREKIIPAYTKEDQSWYSKNDFLMKAINEEFNDEINENKTDRFYLSLFVWKLYENLLNPFSLKKQIVKYGPPGTGKTYLAQQQTALMFDIWKEEFAPNSDFKHDSQIVLIQFHPSFSYEDFIEGLRPTLDGNGTAQLTLQNGVFKAFCQKAGKWEVDVFNLNLNRAWDEITIHELRPFRERLSGDHWQYIFEISDSSKLVSDAVPPFFFIIDEINRAELSRVFGELMFCLEYRGIKGKVKTQYANLNNKETGMLQTDQGHYYFIPTNIYLIGTMNTIDRSVESFDFALRRRFRWEEVKPDIGLLKFHLSEFCKNWLPLADSLEELNNQIAKEPLLGHDYQIGHAYLMNLKYDRSLNATDVRKQVWDDSILPLLQEYLRGTGKEDDLIVNFAKGFGV